MLKLEEKEQYDAKINGLRCVVSGYEFTEATLGYRNGLKCDLNPEVSSSNPAGGSDGMPLGKAFHIIILRSIREGIKLGGPPGENTSRDAPRAFSK